MDVLLTGAGRRNYLVHYFRAAVGPSGTVIACDADPNAPALFEADQGILTPAMDHPDYCDVLFDICKRARVRLIVPVNDLEIPALARHTSRFESIGTIPLVPSPDIVAMCRDKWAMFHWATANGLTVPQTFLTIEDVQTALSRGRVSFPIIVKPRWGTSSICTARVDNPRELALAYEWNRIQLGKTPLAKTTHSERHHFIFQECVTGDEYGIDVVNDLSGNHVTTFGRKKLTMRAGNTDRAISVDEPSLHRLGRSLGEKLRHSAAIDCDVIMSGRACYLLDVNPRLGGGYPFSHMAGANLPAALVAWAAGREADPAWLRARSGIVAARYDGILTGHTVTDAVPAFCGSATLSDTTDTGSR